ncbi:MAG: NTP transferase domain-containing protein [Candidatus Omnitrophica bacterium]|nr:NTP transferase domain-containing protein [Candidatus Omnitrophota bacterium]
MTKIICTISPTTPRLKNVDVARVNGAFGSAKEIAGLIKKIRKNNEGIEILLDLPRDRKKHRTNDLNDDAILDIATAGKIEMVGVSYVRDRKEIDGIKKKILGTGIKVVAKIETAEAIDNIEGIIDASDILMIDRGDLAAAIGIEMLARAQKRVVRKCNQFGKEVIVATELLKSMQTNTEPTKAEVVDIANSISDGADYLMLSEETALGKYPQHAVDVLNRLIDELSENYKVIILSAGENPSLGALSANYHTGLIDIGGTTILESQLAALRRNGIHDEDIIIATGKGDSYIRDKMKNTDVQIVFNPWYNSTNMLTTIWLAKEQIRNGFIVIYGDIVFEPEILKVLLDNKSDIVLAVEKKECDEEDEKICVKNDVMVLHKKYDSLNEPRHKCMPNAEAYGEFIGMAKFNKQGAVLLSKEMDEIMLRREFKTYLMTAFERLVKKGVRLDIEKVNGLLWNDNDTIHDLNKTTKVIYPEIVRKTAGFKRS